MSKPLIVGADATNATEQLYDLVGDDILFDRLGDLADRDPNANCWEDPGVINRLGELGIDINPTTGPQDMTEGHEDSSVASALTRRIMTQRLDLLKKYGPVKVMSAIDSAAEFFGDVEEIGSSDMHAYMQYVEKELAGMGDQGVTEGSRTSTEAIRAAQKMDRDSFIRFATKEYRINADAAGRFWNEVKSGAEFGTTEERGAKKFDPLKHVENPTQGERDAAPYVDRGDYAARAAMLRSAENDGRLKKNKNESINTGDNMRNLREGEIQQASAIVTAKTMVDRVGRWIEELSGMENDTLLQLGDSIRDEMGQEQAKGFIEAVAPAIQSALENLKTTREALASGVRTLTGEEQPANMLGGEPAADMSAEPDAMNPEMGVEEPAGDEFAAAEPATGGAEEAGREMRESIDRQNRLLKVLAG